MNASLATIWEHVAAAIPNAPAVIQGDRSLTFAEFDDTAGRLAAGLQAQGIGAGSTIGCFMYSGTKYLQTVYAAFKLSALPVNINYRYRAEELAYLLADATVDTLVYDASLVAEVEAARKLVPGLRHLVQVGGGSVLEGGTPFEELLATERAVAHAHRSETDAFLLYTGGTTGKPKGLLQLHGRTFQLFSGIAYGFQDKEVPTDARGAAAVACELVAEARAPRMLPLAPLIHGTGFYSTLASLTTGGAAVFTEGRAFDPAEALETIERHGVTHLIIAGNAMGRPLADELVRAADAGRPYDIGSLVFLLSSGAVWSDDVKRTFLEYGRMTLLDSLAASETAAFAIAEAKSVDDLPSRFRLLPHAAVLDEDGNMLEPGADRPGYLALTGPTIPDGYRNDKEKSAQVFREVGGRRWAIPGDLVKLRADGTIEFLGRGSSVINSGGEKIYAEEVEQTLLTHPQVADCAVVGVPDDRWGQVVAALVQVRGVRPSGEELAEHVGHHLAGYKKPRRFVFVDAIPRGETGKLDFPAVREIASAGATS